MRARGLAAVAALVAGGAIGGCALSGKTGSDPAGPTLSSPPGSASSRPVRPGVVSGIVRRDGIPCAATVTATLVRRAPADPDSPNSWWRSFSESWTPVDLHDGMETSPRATAVAGTDGKWTLQGLGPGGFRIDARDADGGRAGRVLELGSAGAQVTWVPGRAWSGDLDLEPAPCTLSGRVRHRDGTAFRGFVAVRRGYVNIDFAPVDAEGRFVLDGLPDDTVELSAVVPGVLEVKGPAVLLPSPPVDFTVEAWEEEAVGTVVEHATGKPVAGAVVAAFVFGDEKERCERVSSDERGRFPVHLAPDVRLRIQVEAAGFVPQRVDHDLPGPARETSFEVRLRRWSAVSGRVLTPDGNPAAGAEVVVIPKWSVPDSPDRRWRATVDGSGRYAVREIRRVPR